MWRAASRNTFRKTRPLWQRAACGLALALAFTLGVQPLARAAEDAPLIASNRTDSIRVVCLGDMLSMGLGLEKPADDCYPAHLTRLLGEGWIVANMAAPRVCVMAAADFPLFRHQAMPSAILYDPDVVVICLGSNDARSNNWPHADEFVKDYTAMVETFKGLPTKPRVWICSPTPVFTNATATIAPATIPEQMLPMLREVSAATGAGFIDFYTPLKDHPDLFLDGFFPTRDGSLRMAELVHAAIAGTKAAAP